MATTRVSVAGDGNQALQESIHPALSADGRFVAFESRAANLVAGDTNRLDDVFVHDRATGAVERVSVASDGSPARGSSEVPSLSLDGRLVAFASNAGIAGLGKVCAVGIVCAMLTAIYLLPVWWQLIAGSRKSIA